MKANRDYKTLEDMVERSGFNVTINELYQIACSKANKAPKNSSESYDQDFYNCIADDLKRVVLNIANFLP